MGLLHCFVFHLDKSFHGEVILMDRWHLEIDILLVYLPVLCQVWFRRVVLWGFIGFSGWQRGESEFWLAFLFLHLKNIEEYTTALMNWITSEYCDDEKLKNTRHCWDNLKLSVLLIFYFSPIWQENMSYSCRFW